MNQPTFIWTVKNADPKNVVTENDLITVNLRDEIKITHDYKMHDQMLVYVGNEKFEVDNDSLEEILKIHMENKDAVMKILNYCKSNCRKI